MNTEQTKQEKVKKQTRLSNGVQNHSEKAIDVQPSNQGTHPRKNERDRDSSLEVKYYRMMVKRKILDIQNKKQNGYILTRI